MRVTQAFTFEAAHFLTGVSETHRCSRLHGHSYRVEMTFEGPVDPTTGFVADFFDIEQQFAPILDQLDHHTLNNVAGLENPTAEHIAAWVFGRWVDVSKRPYLMNVRVYETPMCWADCGEPT